VFRHLTDSVPFAAHRRACRVSRERQVCAALLAIMPGSLLGASLCVEACAGYDTTAMTLAHAVYAIASNSDIEARLLAEIDGFG